MSNRLVTQSGPTANDTTVQGLTKPALLAKLAKNAAKHTQKCRRFHEMARHGRWKWALLVRFPSMTLEPTSRRGLRDCDGLQFGATLSAWLRYRQTVRLPW